MTKRLQVEKVTCRPIGTAVLEIESESNRIKLPVGCEEVRLVSNIGCFIDFGDDSIESTITSIRLVQDTPDKFGVPGNATHLAGMSLEAPGKLCITQMGPG